MAIAISDLRFHQPLTSAQFTVTMTTRLKVQSAQDNTEIDVVVTYDGGSTESSAPAIIISHPYGPLGQ